MIQELMQIIVIGIVAAVFATVLKKHCGEISLLLGLASGAMVGFIFLRLLKPVIAFAEELRDLSGLEQELLEPVLKCLGIGILSQICVNICSDSGQNAIGKMIEMSSCVLCLYIALPLFRGILSLLKGLGGAP